MKLKGQRFNTIEGRWSGGNSLHTHARDGGGSWPGQKYRVVCRTSEPALLEGKYLTPL